MGAITTLRTCGDCTLCCTLCKVPELDKEEGTKCKYCDKNCTIYDTRPESCVAYSCSWLKGTIHESMKPNIVGVMVEEYPEMVALLLDTNTTIQTLPSIVLEEIDRFTSIGLPVIATGQFAKLPIGMTPQEAKDRMIRTINIERR